MNKRMTKDEIISSFEAAIRDKQFFVCYQPQINHLTRRMIGAEALLRWRHPEYGMQYPSDFIPVFEDNNLIQTADKYVFETICMFQKERIDNKRPIVPISFNMSRYDIYQSDFVSEIEDIRRKYNVPVRYLQVEITESSAIGGTELVTDVMNKLHELGYKVEMDDFGSGYSSLNVLKDLDVDVLKLDMRFLGKNIGGRGGIIISSIVNMAKWLETPVIAEGVETEEQADYMRSIGCNLIQGYLYSKPVEADDFVKMLDMVEQEMIGTGFNLIETMNAANFWNPASLETLIFSNLVGAAAIFTYSNDGELEVIRINSKFINELGMNMRETDVVRENPWNYFDEENKVIYKDSLKQAIETGEEIVCETWRNYYSRCCGDDKVCVRSTLRVIGKSESKYLFYTMAQNITAEKRLYNELYQSEKRFRIASDQINEYAWEVDISSREMRPCFRCKRDLGLPDVVYNYPEPVIEDGTFPMDYADLYRDWINQLAEGVGTIEGIIPLTPNRVPFHIRYTTEYDENGRPLKAYGSAALVIENPYEKKN